MSAAVYPSLAGRHVVVTGGATGIGAEIVRHFAAQATHVSILDIADSAGEALATELGSNACYHSCDLTDPAAIAATFAALGPVEVLVNNAANDDRHDLASATAAYFDASIAVNLRHHFLCAQAVAPAMRAAGRGVILNMGSISWRLALPRLAIYETAKAGIEGLTRALARDLGDSGIRVMCVVPGGVVTPRQIELWHDPDGETELLARQCLKFRVMPAHIAAMALFLASDDAAACTARSFEVDAGWS